jgi:hypothetical protein
MRWKWWLIVLLPLTGCAGISDYSPDRGSPSSLTGNQGGTGVQAPFWSSDSSQKTLLNHQGSQP